MPIHIRSAREHNLKDVSVEIGPGLTVVTGLSGSGKTSLVFDTLYHEARRRFLEVYSIGSAVRLAPAEVDEISGLGPAVAVGQNLLNRNPASTIATASGLHPFFRLLYARFGRRECARCGGPLSKLTGDEIIARLAELRSAGPIEIFAPLAQPARGSHRTLLAALAREYPPGSLWIDGDPWDGRTLAGNALHQLEIRIYPPQAASEPAGSAGVPDFRRIIQRAWALGAGGVIARRVEHAPEQSWAFSRVAACIRCGLPYSELRPVHFHQKCARCEGAGCVECAHTGMLPEAAAVQWEGRRLPGLLELSVEDGLRSFEQASIPLGAGRLFEEILARLSALDQVGLGYLGLDRPAPSLSRGEAQRLRLALALQSRLEDVLHVLDEPTVGQHPADVARLLPAFRSLRGPVVFVEHDRAAAAMADQAIDLGPGAGRDGGRVIFTGAPAGLWQADTLTGRYFSLRARPAARPERPSAGKFLVVRGAFLRNLQAIEAIPLPLGRLSVVTGVSGSGKSTLVEDVLAASLAAGGPVGCQGIEGQPLKPVMVDQSPIGRNPRSNPATYSKLADLVRDVFAARAGLTPSHFSFNRPEGACAQCEGLGAVEVAMRYLPSAWITCSACEGQRFSDEVLARRIHLGDRDLNIAGFYELSSSEALQLFLEDQGMPEAQRGPAVRILQALVDIGLGYLPVGQPSPSLSGGEAQRVKLARYLGQKTLAGRLLILDEPSTGLHPADLAGLLAVLDRLVGHGATIVVVEHNLDVIRAADWAIDLGPGSGPRGGRLLYAGPSGGLAAASESLTGAALRAEAALEPAAQAFSAETGSNSISISGARVHNLKNVSVEFPKGKWTVVTGVSGSGKSSLVTDILESEARRRFLETLSLYERQSAHEGPQAEVDEVSGLGVALAIAPERVVFLRRATVGTATEISPGLAALLATIGETAAGSSLPAARYFSPTTYAAACLRCNGVGTLIEPRPEKLIIHPEKPLISGAMYSPGFFPNGYLGKPLNYGYYLLQALGRAYDFDPAGTPWNEMTLAAQQAFLFGTQEELPVTLETRKGGTRSYLARFPGFYGFIRDWDVGGTYSASVPCPDCGGARLRPQYLAVTLGGFNIHQLSRLPLAELRVVMQRIEQALPAAEIRTGVIALAAPVLRTVLRRLQFLVSVGLGYLHLDRVAGTLSAGEVQRIRLAGLLGSGLTALTLLLDEPTRGLHPSEVEALSAALLDLRRQGNTVITVEHDPQIITAADHLIDIGPGAGAQGGQVVYQGPPGQAAATPTGLWLRGERRLERFSPRKPSGWLEIRGARANNLKNLDVRLPLGVLAGVCGVSGSGKSTLVIDTLGRALAPKKQTTSVAYEPVEPGEHDSITGAPKRALLVDQGRAGLTSPASFLGLAPVLHSLYAESEDAQAFGVSPESLERGCSACQGRGYLHLDMEFLPDVRLPCETCQGTGFLPEAWKIRLHGVALPEAFRLSIDEAYRLFGEDERLGRPLQAAREVGLGYLALRQPGYALSGGEAQRLKIAAELARRRLPGQLYILDEPTVGQHLDDVTRLAGVLRRLAADGASVLIVEHHPHLLAACDWLVELGPGGGPHGGFLIAAGTPEDLASGSTPTAAYLREVLA